MQKQSFLKSYQSRIMPKIKELDLLMKEDGSLIDISRLSCAISADESEIYQILDSLNESSPTKENIFDIIARCKSSICRMIMRESICGSPKSYTPFQIAYIYQLSTREVQKTFEYLHIDKARPSDLYNIFENIQDNSKY